MDLHLELIKVEPVPGLLRVQVVVEVPGREPETMKPQLGSQQQTRRALLIGHPGVAALPAPARVGGKKSRHGEKATGRNVRVITTGSYFIMCMASESCVKLNA